MDMNLAKGLGVYAGLGIGMAGAATTLGIGSLHAFKKADAQDSDLAKAGIIAAAVPIASLAGGLALFTAMAPFGAFGGVYGNAQPHLGGKLLAFAATGAAVAAGVTGVIAGAKALGVLPGQSE